MKILIVSHNFPLSHNDMHGKRSASIAKYLQEEGFETTLLTSVNFDKLSEEIITDFNVRNYYSAKSFPIKKFGYKTKMLVLIDLLKLNNLLFFPDMCFTWIKKAVKRGKEIIEQDKPDLIYAIMNPYSSFVVAYKLSKKHNIPLILDYSDPYSCHPFEKSKFLRRRKINLERKIYDHSILKINIGEECADLTNFCLDRRDKFEIIHTGFFDEFVHKTVRRSERFTLSYLGSFYGLMNSTFNEFVFALSDFISNDKISSEDLKFVYAGGVSRRVIGRIIKEFKLKDYFIDLGKITQEQCYIETQKNHVSLFFSPKGAEYILPTKAYDCAVNNTHVLIIGEECATTEFYDKIEQKYTLVVNNVISIRIIISFLFWEWKEGVLEFGCNEEKLQEYSRRNQTKKLAKILRGFECIKN